MTAAVTPDVPLAGRYRLAGLRLIGLHLISRQAPTALAALVVCGVILRVALQLHWISGGGTLAQQVPVLLEGAAAAIVAITTRNPFGEPERASGRWLPLLRLGSAVLMTTAGFAVLALAATAAHLPEGNLAVLRNIAGMMGIGLVVATVLGGAPAWIGPLTYAAMAEFTLPGHWHSPWMWPARPADDLGAVLCAGLVFAVGLVAFTARGSRDNTSGD